MLLVLPLQGLKKIKLPYDRFTNYHKKMGIFYYGTNS
jgi:hypothetical protein